MATEAAPPKAENMEPMKAKEEPRNTGLALLVKSRYTMEPTPAPNSAAEADIPLPTTAGTAMVAAMIANSCCSAKSTTCPNLGLSLIP